MYRWACASSRIPLSPRIHHPRRFFAVREVLTRHDRGSLITVHSSNLTWQRSAMAAEERLRESTSDEEHVKGATLDEAHLKPSSFSFSIREACGRRTSGCESVSRC